MVSCSISSIKDLNAAIAAHNPFAYPAWVTERDIWGQPLPNLSILNDPPTRAVLYAIEQARTHQCPLTSIAVIGNRGTGKTHLIAHLRDRVQHNDTALFAYVNAGQITDLNLIRYQFHQRVVESLRHTGRLGVMQWQELATQIANEALRSINADARFFSPQELATKLNHNTLSKNQTWVTQLTEAFFRIKPQLGDPDLVRAIIWTLSNSQAPYSIKWLSGQLIADYKADELGLPNRSREYRDPDAWEILVQIFSIISEYYPLAICFDQIESADNSDAGLKRERVVASLVKRMWDTLPMARLHYGIVILNVMTNETWNTKVTSLPPGIAAYLSKHGEPMQLSAIAGDRIFELVSVWLRRFYQRHKLTPPTEIYPFEAGQLQALAREQLNLREVLEWCSQNFHPIEADPFEQVETAFEQAKVAVDIPAALENNALLSQVLYFGFQCAIADRMAGVSIQGVTDEIQHHPINRGYIQFTVIGQADSTPVNIGVAILQDTNAKKVSAGLKRLVEYPTFGLTGGCLLRSYDKPIPCHWQAYPYLRQFTSQLGGEWIDLKVTDIEALVAIWWVYLHQSEYGVSEEQIFEFIAHRKLAAENPLLRQIVKNCVADRLTEDLLSEETDSTLAEHSQMVTEYPDLAMFDVTGDGQDD